MSVFLGPLCPSSAVVCARIVIAANIEESQSTRHLSWLEVLCWFGYTLDEGVFVHLAEMKALCCVCCEDFEGDGLMC